MLAHGAAPAVHNRASFGMMGLSHIEGGFMRKIALTTLLAASLGMAGCAGVIRTQPAPGDTVETVLSKMGKPTAIYPEGDGQEFEYATGPMGQYTFMAHIGPDQRLRGFEQVLSAEGYGRIKVDVATKDEVLRLIGHPAEHSHVALNDYEVWSYRYKENGVWNSMMHVHFDRAGVVRMMMNGPDPMYEEKRFFRD